MTRHFMTIEQLSDADLMSIYTLATSPFDDETLKGQGVALIFERPSLRTRASSSTAVHELGGYATFFSDEEIGIDSRETAEDIGRTSPRCTPSRPCVFATTTCWDECARPRASGCR